MSLSRIIIGDWSEFTYPMSNCYDLRKLYGYVYASSEPAAFAMLADIEEIHPIKSQQAAAIAIAAAYAVAQATGGAK